MRITRTPYIKGPLQALNSPFIEWIVLVWGRQLAKSTLIFAYLCYCIGEDPAPAICLYPTELKAKFTSKKRLWPMFNACEAVRSQKTPDQDDFTISEMQFRNMVLSMVWGGSDTQLTSRPARYLFRDEVDELKRSVGANAIDPMAAIEQVTTTFGNRKIIDSSTPTTPQGNIWSELGRCQMVCEDWVACPHCGTKQILYWENVRYGDDDDPEVVETNAYYECESCHGGISNLEKLRVLGSGEWRARTTVDPCNQILKNVRAKIGETISLDEILENRRIKKVGFHLPKWYSPFPGGTFGMIAKEFLEADEAEKKGEDFKPKRNWRMYNAALPYEQIAISESESEMMGNIINFPPLLCPKGTVALTAGADPGQGGFWFVVKAWKPDMSSHLVHYGWMAGDYDNSGIEDLVNQWIYRIEDEERQLRIWRIGLDTGGSKYDTADLTMTEAAYTWIRKMRRPGLVGTKGMSHPSAHRIREARIDKMPGTKGTLIPGGLLLIEINTDAMKDALWFHLGIEAGKPGRFTFHNQTGKDYVQHLLAEEKRLQKNGKWEWVRLKKTNHLLDCTIIADSLADPECQGGVRVISTGGRERRQISKGVGQ